MPVEQKEKDSLFLSDGEARSRKIGRMKKMSVQIVKIMMVILATVAFGMAGCGGGGASTPTVVNTNTYSTAKILPLTATGTTTFTLTGNDTSGGSWSGSVQMRGDGSTVFEGHSVIELKWNN
jgi:hypothetical protein